MIDKRLYKDISDLLELNVSDDKIVRIMMVRGFTTEQVKRVIRDIRTKTAPISVADKKTEPVSELIETNPSKRFSGLAKLFGKSQNEDEILTEETQKLVEHEHLLKKEEAKIHAEVKELMDEEDAPPEKKQKRTTIGVPDDVKDVLKMVDDLLEKLPDEEITRFSQSPQFEKYKAVMKKYVG